VLVRVVTLNDLAPQIKQLCLLIPLIW